MRHSKVGAQILYLLKNVVDRRGHGEVYGADVGLVLPNRNIRSPDVCFVRREKLPEGEEPEGFGELVPDLVVEVLSPGDRMRQVAPKRLPSRWPESTKTVSGIPGAVQMAKRMNSSRAAFNRLLDPDYEAVTLETLQRAAAAVGRHLRLEFV